MQTLRKKTSPLKYKNETTRFLGDGVSFKAKLIGILEVSEARGDRMCQEALSDLKMAIRAAGEHKQRITINIAIDGLRLRDEKTGDSLYHHPVHKISFIAQDMTDSRAFGYIFGSPDTGHRFFGIKTDKAASQVVIAMRDLFQVVFALKKKEIELAKQHLDKTRFTSSPLFSDSSISSSKTVTQESSKGSSHETKAGAGSDLGKSGGTAVADLVDLELELNSLQQGLNQMERITPSDPFGSKDDPFGDSFTSYTKPILPPPPSSGRERSSRTSETGSVFSPRTPHTASLDTSVESKSRKDFSFSQDFNSSREEPSSGDWFTPPAGNSIFEEPPLVPEPTKDEKHELAKLEILSQFDVFTELDPLELKNPPKKVLNDLVSQSGTAEAATVLNPTFAQPKTGTVAPSGGDFSSDPFGEDPFVTEDPFADSDFSKQDPFESEFGDFKRMSNPARSPRTLSTSPRTHHPKPSAHEVRQLHENPSLDMSSESEAAPEPPPRPTATLTHQIKPPPLPPKKQSNDMAVKPPPRPPHVEDSVYLYMDHYSTAPSSLEFVRNSSNNAVEKSPPIPVPARKTHRYDDFGKAPPERPQKFHFRQSSDEDYLTPVTFTSNSSVEAKKSIGILLPPPQRAAKKVAALANNVTPVKPADVSLDGLDITLSQLTLSGLNELASKLKIPASELSNMTLVQLTNYISNFIKDKTGASSSSSTNRNQIGNEFPSFKADFAANFATFSATNPTESSYDRYAVFRELIQEEIKQTKIDTEPEELREEQEKLAQSDDSLNKNEAIVEIKEVVVVSNGEDKYAALREIVEIELKMATTEITPPADDVTNENDVASVDVKDGDEVKQINVINEGEPVPVTQIEEATDIINTVNLENNKLVLETETKKSPNKYNLIEYSAPLDNAKETKVEPLKSPKSPSNRLNNPLKSPVPVAITEIMQNTARLTSGSLSDVVSGSSPEVDNTASNSEMLGKKNGDAAGETWAIFDQSNNTIPSEGKEKQVQSEEGVSPWSSDSKEFGNGSPPDWRRGDSESGGDKWPKRRGRRDQEGWWDTSAEPEGQYYPSANRRSTDSYEEEYYECYDRPRRRKQTSYGHGQAQAAGGHSSSSRDVSPWEEEPRRVREPRPGWGRHPRQHSFDKLRDRRHTDSWDEEDGYEESYEEDHPSRFHRHNPRESDRWTDDRGDDRRHRRRREGESRERWCCPDWEQPEHDKPPPRYGSGRWAGQEGPPVRRDRYYSRESQESPWEDEYSNEVEEPPASHYPAGKRNWKRPSSASEMDRKTGEIKSRHYLGTGGSDGERDRRYKPGRRSRSRDSQYSEPGHRHKAEIVAPPRNPHRSRQYQHPSKQFEPDFTDTVKKPVESALSKIDHLKKCSTLAGRGKKTKDSLKTEENTVSTFPRKSSSRGKSLFENDFVSQENDFETSEAESPIVTKPLKALRTQMSMFEKSTGDVEFPRESFRHRSLKETRATPRFPTIVANKPKSLFEDDFSPSDKPEPLPEDNSISSIKEENDPNEEDDSFGASNFETSIANSRKKKLNKHRLSADGTKIKKSESVNIFTQENDPFDDDFFSENAEILGEEEMSPRTTDLRWTDDFEEYTAKRK